MSPLAIDLIVAFVPFTFAITFQLYLVRVHLVLYKRLKLLREDYETYQCLPPLNAMVRRFWVWDMEKFVKREDTNG